MILTNLPGSAWRILTVLALAVSLAACVTVDDEPRDAKPIPQRLLSQMKSKGMSPADPIMIRIYKQESELELWKRDRTSKFALLKTYPICRWSGKLGPKRVEGDRQAPEGFYAVSAGMLNPRSKFHLSFDLGFPNRLEKALGYDGSSLMVHGACTSSGCYAVTRASYLKDREKLGGTRLGITGSSGMPSILRRGIAERIPIRAHCFAAGCNHSAELDLVALARRLGADHGAMHNDLVPKLRCTKCGSKQVGIRVSYSRLHKGVHQS